MPVRKVSVKSTTNTQSVEGIATTGGTQVKRVTLGRPVRRVSADNGSLENLNNVSASNAEDGDVLVYHEEDQKWHAQKLLHKQDINGGQY